MLGPRREDAGDFRVAENDGVVLHAAAARVRDDARKVVGADAVGRLARQTELLLPLAQRRDQILACALAVKQSNGPGSFALRVSSPLGLQISSAVLVCVKHSRTKVKLSVCGTRESLMQTHEGALLLFWSVALMH